MDPMGYDSSLFLGGKPFFKGTLKHSFEFPQILTSVKSPTEKKHTQQIWNWPDLSTTKVSTSEISHGASNSQLSKSQREIPSFLLTNNVFMFSGVLLRVQSEAGFSPKATGGASLPGRRPKKTEFLFFLEWKAKTRKFDEIHVCCFIWLYLQYTYTCWYPVVGFFVINVGEYTIYGSDVSWIQDNKDDQKTCATPDIFLWKKLISTEYTNPPLELQTTSLKWMFGETTVF